MQLDLDNLPTDTALLHRLVRDIVGTIEHRDSEIERLKSIIKQLAASAVRPPFRAPRSRSAGARA